MSKDLACIGNFSIAELKSLGVDVSVAASLPSEILSGAIADLRRKKQKIGIDNVRKMSAEELFNLALSPNLKDIINIDETIDIINYLSNMMGPDLGHQDKKKVPKPSTSDSKNIEKEGKCCVCWDNAAICATVPCGHKCLCVQCSGKISNKCPKCKQKIDQIIKIYSE